MRVLIGMILNYQTYGSSSDSPHHGEPFPVAFWPPQLRRSGFLAAAAFRFELATSKYPFLTLRPIAGAVGGLRTQLRDAPQFREQGLSDAVWRSADAGTQISTLGGYPKGS